MESAMDLFLAVWGAAISRRIHRSHGNQFWMLRNTSVSP
jgi:hypothetical protein